MGWNALLNTFFAFFLLPGRLLPATLATVALQVLAWLAIGVYVAVAESPLEKMADIRRIMERPRLDGIHDPADFLPGWYTSW